MTIPSNQQPHSEPRWNDIVGTARSLYDAEVGEMDVIRLRRRVSSAVAASGRRHRSGARWMALLAAGLGFAALGLSLVDLSTPSLTPAYSIQLTASGAVRIDFRNSERPHRVARYQNPGEQAPEASTLVKGSFVDEESAPAPGTAVFYRIYD